MARRKRNKTEDRSLPKAIAKQKYTIQAAPSSGKCPWAPTNTKIIEPIQIEAPSKENKTKKLAVSNKYQTYSKVTKNIPVESNEKKYEQGKKEEKEKEKEEIPDGTVETQTALSTDDSSSQCSFTFAPLPPPSPNSTNYSNDNFQNSNNTSSSSSSIRSRQINNIFNSQQQNQCQIQQSYKSVTMIGTQLNSSKTVKYQQKRSQSESNEKNPRVGNASVEDDKMQYSSIVSDSSKQQQQQIYIHDKKHVKVQTNGDIDNNAQIQLEKPIPNFLKNAHYNKIIVPIQISEPRNLAEHPSVAHQHAQHANYYKSSQHQGFQNGYNQQLSETADMFPLHQQYVQYAQNVQYENHAEKISNPCKMSHEHVQYVPNLGDTSKDSGDSHSSQESQDTKIFELQQQQQYLSDKLVYWAMCNFCLSSPKDASNFDFEGSFSRLRRLQCYGPGRFGGNLQDNLKTSPYFRM